jgi:hypothetical protein
MLTLLNVIAGLAVCVALVAVGLWHSSKPTRTVTQILAELEAAPAKHR